MMMMMYTANILSKNAYLYLRLVYYVYGGISVCFTSRFALIIILYIYYEIVHKVHNKKKMKKRQGKNKTTK